MKVLFFDGYCSLCNRWVDFMIRLDRKQRIRFASLQGETAKKCLPPSWLSSAEPETVLYFHDGLIEERSTGILRCLQEIGGLSRALATVTLLIPSSLRDWVYRSVARHRYSLFGRREICRVPSAREKDRFLP